MKIYEKFEENLSSEIKKIEILDFDSTTFDSPLKPGGYKGDWWGEPLSLKYEYVGQALPEYSAVFIPEEQKSKITKLFNDIISKIDLKFTGDLTYKAEHVTILHYKKIKKDKLEKLKNEKLGEEISLKVGDLYIIDKEDYFSAALEIEGIEVETGVPHLTIAYGGEGASAKDSIETISKPEKNKDNLYIFEDLKGQSLSGKIGFVDMKTKKIKYEIEEVDDKGFTRRELDYKGLANDEIVNIAKKAISSNDSIAFIVTGRVEKLRPEVSHILSEIGLDELANDDFLFMNDKPIIRDEETGEKKVGPRSNPTLAFKTLIFRELISAVIRQNYENGFYDNQEGDEIQTGIIANSYDDRGEEGHVAHFQKNIIDIFINDGLPIEGRRYKISPLSKSYEVKI